MLVATIRALKMHGGVKKDDLKKENLGALETGMSNLQCHVENVRKFGLEPVISINRFSSDSTPRSSWSKTACAQLGVECYMADHWAMGGEGATDLARAVVKRLRQRQEQVDVPLSRRDAALRKDSHHRAGDLSREGCLGRKRVKDQLASFEAMGYGTAPICVAKTQYSFSTNPDAKGAPVVTRSTCAKCGSRRARNSWSRSAARS